MKKFLKSFLALALTGATFLFSGCSDLENDLNSLKDRVDALETGKIAGVEEQVAALQTALDNAEASIKSLESLASDVDALQQKVEGMATSAELAALQSSVNELKALVEAVDLSKYETVEHAAATYATKETVKNLETALGTAEGNIAKILTALGNIEGLGEDETIIGLINTVKASAAAAQSTADAAQSTASSALGKIEALENALGAYAEVGKLQAALDQKLDISEFDTEFNEALAAALAQDGEVTGEIAKAIQEATDKVSKLFANRLTSISLIPTAYLEGVPVIKFSSYLYTVKTVDKGKEEVKDTEEEKRITAEATDVNYHISPSYVTKEDIETPSYLIQEAELLTKANPDIALNVVDYEIEKDVLTVTVRRDAGISLNHPDETHIYTAALKVPVAEKNLIEGETEANVYSEYSALYEDVVTPRIAALIDESKEQKSYACKTDAHSHFYATYTEAAQTTSDVAKNCAYNEDIDLLEMVTGCDGSKEIKKATLKENGLAFRFAVPTVPFEVGDNKTDQQKFAYVEGNTLKSTYVNAPEGAEPNQASIDKTPVVRVELVDTVNSNIVDVRYFKIKWTPVPFVPEDEDLGLIYTFTDILGCADFDGDITWDIFVEKVLSQVNNGQGLSYNEFVKIYKSGDAEVKVDYPIASGHDNTMTVTWDDTDTYDEHAAAFHWNILPEEYGNLIDGKSVDEIEENQLLKTFTATIELPSNDDYNGTITFKIAVNVVAPELPALVGLNNLDWIVDGELARVRPVQLGSQSASSYVTYNYDLTTLFREGSDGIIMTNAMPIESDDESACRAWSLQFAKDQMTKYIPGFGKTALYADEAATAGAGYDLYSGDVRATYMKYNDNGSGDGNATENWHQDVHNDISLGLTGQEWPEAGAGHYRGTDEAIALLESINTPVDEFTKRVTINAWGRINPYNHVLVKTFDVVYIKPLYVIENPDNNQCFEDGYEGGRYINVEDIFKAEDSWSYPVNIYTVPDAEGEVAEANARKVYYDVQDPEFDLADARIGMELVSGNYQPVENGAQLTDAEIEKMPKLSAFDTNASVQEADRDSDGINELVFKSERGWNLEKVVYIYVKVSIDHKWGTESMWVHIPVYPHGQVPQI